MSYPQLSSTGRRFVVILGVGTLLACGGDEGGPGVQPPPPDPCIANPAGPNCPNEVVGLQLTPADASVLRGATVTLTARFLNRVGQTSTPASVAWVVVDSAVANVSGSGATVTVTSRRRGFTNLRATATTPAGVTLSQVGGVRVLDAVSVQLLPDTLRLVAGDSTFVRYVLTADAGVDTTATLVSLAPGIATVSATGRVVAVAPGSAAIVATSRANALLQDTTRVLVSARGPVVTSVRITYSLNTVCGGNTLTATASPLDAAGVPFPRAGLTPTWSSTDPTFFGLSATADPWVVSLTPPRAGTASLSVAVAGGSAVLTDARPLQVLPPVSAVGVALVSPSISVGQAAQATAAVLDCRGAATTGFTPAWSSGNSAVATVSPVGVVTGVSAGTTDITASAAGVTGRVTVTVTTPTVGQVVAVSTSTLPTETILAPVQDVPSVRVLLSNGQPAAGVPVQFVVGSGGGTIAPTTPVNTDASGIARLTSWTMGASLGPNTLTASATGTTSRVTFTATAASPRFTVDPQPVCRALLACALGFTLTDNRGQPMRSLPVTMSVDATPTGSSFSQTQLVTAPTGYASTEWFLPTRVLFTGRAQLGGVAFPVSRQAILPDFSKAVAGGTIEQLQRNGPPTRVGNVVVSLRRRPAGPTYGSSPSTANLGAWDSGEIEPGVYDGEIPVGVGVVRAVKFFGLALSGGTVATVGTLRIPAGTTGGNLTLCLTGPANTTSIVDLFDGLGGTGGEVGRQVYPLSPGTPAGCYTDYVLEGEYLVRIRRTGRPDFFTQVVVNTDFNTPFPAVNITIP